MDEMLKMLQTIGESMKRLSQDAETRSRAVIGLTEIMEGRAREISRTWETQVSEACAQIVQASGSAQYLQSNAQDALALLSRLISGMEKMQVQNRRGERRRMLLTSLLSAFLTSLLSPLIWHLCARLL